MRIVSANPAALAAFAVITSLAPLAPVTAFAQTAPPAAASAQQPTTAVAVVAPTADRLASGRITGVGGIFFRSRNPKALMAWYRETLGLKVEDWGGVVMSYEAPRHPPAVTVTAFPEASAMMSPSRREFMINFAVDDLDAFLARLKAKNVTVLKRDDNDPYGRFAWILDPDGTKIELYEPKPDQSGG